MNEIKKLLDYITTLEGKTCLKDEVLYKLENEYKKHPCYGYVKASLLTGYKNAKEEKYFYEKYYYLLKKSADKGCKEAQYIIANKLYDEKKYVDAIKLYKESADKGYALSQWCYGIDNYNGIKDIYPKNIEEGLKYISYAAGQKYEFAIDFLIDFYSSTYKDIEKVKYYKCMLEWHDLK